MTIPEHAAEPRAERRPPNPQPVRLSHLALGGFVLASMGAVAVLGAWGGLLAGARNAMRERGR